MGKDIDFLLIWKKVHSSLSGDEEQALQKWLNEKPEHKVFYENALRYYQGNIRRPKPHLSSLQNLKSNLIFAEEPKVAKRSSKWYYLAAVFASIILSTVFLLEILAPEKQMVTAEDYMDSIKTGHDVLLITSNGLALSLVENQSHAIEDDFADVTSIDNGLSYQARPSQKQPENQNALIVPRGKFFNLELPDGTKVWLNSESVLHYPSKFEKDSRQVRLTGEAYFEVVKDVKRPFTVQSESQQITVLGTAFNISSYPEDENNVTTLVEGSVKITQTNGQSHVLVPGDQSILDKKSGEFSKQQVDVSSFISWKDGILQFNEMELRLILAKISRWYDIDLFYENTSVADKKFTGEIERFSDINKLLDLLRATGTVDFTVSGNALIIK